MISLRLKGNGDDCQPCGPDHKDASAMKLRMSKEKKGSYASVKSATRGAVHHYAVKTHDQGYAASDPGTIARGPNFARARSATASIRRARSSAGSSVS